MSTLRYQITLVRTDGTTVQLSNCCAVTDGAVRVVCEVPEGRLQAVRATMPLRTAGDERIFMNGYQTWTYCPEYIPRIARRAPPGRGTSTRAPNAAQSGPGNHGFRSGT